jgi:fructose transport system substrate-binding protein
MDNAVARRRRGRAALLGLVVALLATGCAGRNDDSGSSGGSQVQVGLITKTETNPFFVKMKEGAQKEAQAKGAKLLTAAGKFDGDNASQVTAIENMVAAGVKGILITPSDTKAIVPAIKKARDKGVLVIALDTPTQPQDATDALFATDNFKAGVLIGQYAKAAEAGKQAKIATLDLAPGISVGVLRHNGFLSGYGAAQVDQSAHPAGHRARGRLQPGHAGRSGQGSDGDGELPAEGPRHQPGLHHQRTGGARRLQRAQGGG